MFVIAYNTGKQKDRKISMSVIALYRQRIEREVNVIYIYSQYSANRQIYLCREMLYIYRVEGQIDINVSGIYVMYVCVDDYIVVLETLLSTCIEDTGDK